MLITRGSFAQLKESRLLRIIHLKTGLIFCLKFTWLILKEFDPTPVYNVSKALDNTSDVDVPTNKSIRFAEGLYWICVIVLNYVLTNFSIDWPWFLSNPNFILRSSLFITTLWIFFSFLHIWELIRIFMNTNYEKWEKTLFIKYIIINCYIIFFTLINFRENIIFSSS